MDNNVKIESHPWPPFLPREARMLMLGTFPPKPERWSMDFFYPNKINDMWRIMGEVFYADRNYFWIDDEKRFNREMIESFLDEIGLALWDTGMKVRRLKDNASDKFLEIVEPINLQEILSNNPKIAAIVTAGEKATGVVAEIVGCEAPKTGESVDFNYIGRSFRLYRMPSSSRAYPLSLEKKSEIYRQMFIKECMLVSPIQ